jgi:hypothetical protein
MYNIRQLDYSYLREDTRGYIYNMKSKLISDQLGFHIDGRKLFPVLRLYSKAATALCHNRTHDISKRRQKVLVISSLTK